MPSLSLASAAAATAAMISSRDVEEGKRIAEMAYKIEPIPIEGISKAIEVVIYISCIVCTIIVFLRIYARSVASNKTLLELGWDDYLAFAGWVPFIPSIVFCMIAVKYGLGAADDRIPEGQMPYYQARIKETIIYFELIYFATSLTTKFAMAIMILRLTTQKRYSYVIWGSMIMMGFIGMGCLGVMFGNCRPFPATWNEQLGTCTWPDSEGWVLLSYFGCGGLAVVDWACAITPFFILQSLQMGLRKKLSIQLILGLGLVGSAAGLVRIPYFRYYNVAKYPNDSLANWGHTVLWSVLEAALGIIACSLPPLRSLVSRFYRGSSNNSNMKVGGSGNDLQTIGGGRVPSRNALGGSHGTKLSSLTPQGRNWDRLDDESQTGSQEGIMRVTEVRIESHKKS